MIFHEVKAATQTGAIGSDEAIEPISDGDVNSRDHRGQKLHEGERGKAASLV